MPLGRADREVARRRRARLGRLGHRAGERLRELAAHGALFGLTGHELADQNRSPPSRGELTPFSERGSAVSLENIAAVEVAVLVEVVVDRSIDIGEIGGHLIGLDVRY